MLAFENIIAPYFKEKQSVYVENKCVFFLIKISSFQFSPYLHTYISCLFRDYLYTILRLRMKNFYFSASQLKSTVQSLLLSSKEYNETISTKSTLIFCISLVNMPVAILSLSVSISLGYHGFQGLLREKKMFLLSVHDFQ